MLYENPVVYDPFQNINLNPSIRKSRRLVYKPRKGLGDFSSAYKDAASYVQTGVDASGNAYITFLGTPYYDPNALSRALDAKMAALESGTPYFYSINPVISLLRSSLSYGQPSPNDWNRLMLDLINTIRANGMAPNIPFSAYQAPVSSAPSSSAVIPSVPTVKSVAIPDGYKSLNVGVPNGQGFYVASTDYNVPLYDESSQVVFATGPGVYVPDGARVIVLDPLLLRAGLIGFGNDRDSGPVDLNGRRYERHDIDVVDPTHNKTYSVHVFLEGGSAGNFLEAYAADIFRALTAAGTLGQSEILRATGQKDLAQKIETVYGAGSVAAITAAVTGGVLAPSAVAAALTSGGVAGLVAGGVGVAKDQSAQQVFENAAKSGAAAGASAGIVKGILDASQTAQAIADNFVPYQPGAVTLTPATAGSTYLPDSLSLVQSSAQVAINPASIISGLTDSSIAPLAQNTKTVLTAAPEIQNAGSTLLPPSLSLNPPLGIVTPPGTDGGLINSILNAGKAAIPTAGAVYKAYQALTPGSSSGGGSADVLAFVGDPNALAPAPVAPSQIGIPLLAGAALLFFLYANS